MHQFRAFQSDATLLSVYFVQHCCQSNNSGSYLFKPLNLGFPFPEKLPKISDSSEKRKLLQCPGRQLQKDVAPRRSSLVHSSTLCSLPSHGDRSTSLHPLDQEAERPCSRQSTLKDLTTIAFPCHEPLHNCADCVFVFRS